MEQNFNPKVLLIGLSWTGPRTIKLNVLYKEGYDPNFELRNVFLLIAASSQRDSLVNSLDNFFSSTSSNKGSSSKKSPRKTQAKVRESEDDDDDDDDDDIVVSSLSKLKSRKGQQTRKDSRDSGWCMSTSVMQALNWFLTLFLSWQSHDCRVFHFTPPCVYILYLCPVYLSLPIP